MRSRHWIFSMVAFVMAAALAWSAVATVLKTKLTASDAAASDIFGWSVSISGDWAIVGASGDDDDGEDSGSAYLFKRDGEVWDQKQKLTAEDADASDYFGMSVSIDGYWAIVGAERNDDDGEDSGSAYIFLTRDSTSWTELAKLTAADADTQDLFGKSVSIDGEYAIVGAEQDDDARVGSQGNVGQARVGQHHPTNRLGCRRPDPGSQAAVTGGDGGPEARCEVEGAAGVLEIRPSGDRDPLASGLEVRPEDTIDDTIYDTNYDTIYDIIYDTIHDTIYDSIDDTI